MRALDEKQKQKTSSPKKSGTSQCSDLVQLAPTIKGLSICNNVQRLTLQWLIIIIIIIIIYI